MDFYKSLNVDKIAEEANIINLAGERGVIVDSLRYGITKGTFRGAIKDIKGDLYYFHYNDRDFRVVKSGNPEKEKELLNILHKCKLGCDLIKADDTEKAEGQSPTAALPTIPEDQDVEAQDRLTTDRHPGSTGAGTTPDRPEVGRVWHPEDDPETVQKNNSWDYNSILKSLGYSFKKNARVIKSSYSPQEKKFMVEVLGKSPEDVENGYVKMNPTQKVIYRKWLNKSARNKIKNLSKFIND